MRGDPFIFSFPEGISTKDFFGHVYTRGHFFGRPFLTDSQQQEILEYFEGRENVVEDCIREIIHLDPGKDSCVNNCGFETSCRRLLLEK